MNPFSKALLYTGLGTILGLCCVVAFHLWWLRNKRVPRLNAALVYGIFWALVIGSFILDCVSFGSQDQEIQALLAGLAGAAAGWIIGMWISPDTSEKTSFGRYWTAIGVGSGVTLKWAFDQAWDRRPWFHNHWLVAEVFAIAFLATVGAVYSARAYNNSLTVRARKSAAYPNDAVVTPPIKIIRAEPLVFYAEIIGPSDAYSRWSVEPPSLGSITDEGQFTATANTAVTGKGKIIAVNVEDPSLSNFIEIELS